MEGGGRDRSRSRSPRRGRDDDDKRSRYSDRHHPYSRSSRRSRSPSPDEHERSRSSSPVREYRSRNSSLSPQRDYRRRSSPPPRSSYRGYDRGKTEGWREKKKFRDNTQQRARKFSDPPTYRADSISGKQDKNSNPHTRRWDSLARLLHIAGTVTTAVGLDKKGVLRIGVNRLYGERQRDHDDVVDNRLREIGYFLDSKKRDAADVLDRKEFSPRLLDTEFSGGRFRHDLRKLARSLNQEYEKGSRRNLPPELRDAILKRRFVVFATGTEKHAELEVAKDIDSGPIGVTRLNCLNCWEDLPAINQNVETRGTHNFRFPNQVSGAKTKGYFITPRQQFPEDSDSEDE